MKDPFAVERAVAQTKIKAEKKQSDEFLDTFGKPLLKALKGDLEPLIKANKGEAGKTPIKGTDYFTDVEIEAIKKDVLALIPTPENGKDAEVNYDLVFAYVVEQISKLPKPKDGEPGKDAVVDTAQIIVEVLKQIPKTEKLTVDYSKIQDLIDKKVKTIPWNEKRVVGYSSLKQLTDVILDGVPQDSKGNYILTPGGTGGGHTIEDEGTPLTQRTNLNFVGAGVTVTDDAGNDATVVTIPGGGGGGTPGGTDTQVQFNDGGAFGGDAGLTYNKTTDTLTSANVSAGTVRVTDGAAQDYTITSNGNEGLHIDGTVSGTLAEVDLSSADKDGTDNVAFKTFGVGDAGSANVERLTMGYVAANTDYRIHTSAVGTGVVRPLRIFTGVNTSQIVLNTDGTTTFGGNISASNLSGTNTGDQTTIVGITGTKAQFDTAVTDGNFLYVGDVTQYTDEQAQDAVGTILTDTTSIDLIYDDAGNTISAQREALTGAITAPKNSNTTSLGSFTKAQLDTAVSDGNIQYVGDAPTAHTHLLAAGATDVTITAANLNTLDDGVNTTLHFHDADRNRANHSGTQTASTISDFTETAQDAVGAMVDTTLTYVDGTPLLQRSALTGAVTASAGSNTTALGSFTKAQLDTAVSDGNVLYVGDVTTNATHTGEVTGSGALTVDKTAITNKTLVTAAVGDQILIADASDTDNLKRVTVQTIVDLAGGGGSTTVAVAQTTHGLSAGNLIRSNGTNGQYAVADKDVSAQADAVGYVTAVADANNFTYQPLGHYITNNVPAVAAGTALYVGDSGALTSTQPVAIGEIQKPVAIVVHNATAMVMFNMRGMEVTAVTSPLPSVTIGLATALAAGFNSI